MSGVGPVEPGEGTRAWDAPDPAAPPLPRPRAWRPARFLARHRRAVLGAAAAALLLAGGGYLVATRPQPPAPPAPRPAPDPPYPSQVVDISYLEPAPAPRGAGPRSFALTVLVSVASGPPVALTEITQPYDGVALTSTPPTPFRVRAGSARKVLITMRVTKCGRVPVDAGLPFLDVTLSNTRAIELHSYILGPRYAHALSEALYVACGNDFR
ncbi:Tat pathway signal sequence domain protein [Streptomyces sp. NPDC004065]|uniref:Tat pathway signal sequence domain protein n=1 Tax=Streptomyces sp. NPDC004065 TaxID=3364689 RepID=UPI00384BF5A5